MTAPLTPPDCDLTSFQRMMIDIPRLRGSDFDATLDDGAWRAGLNLWLSSWHQVPAGSLSDDDATLTKAAGLGRDIRSWRKVRAEALRGWVKCDDGLLYHPVVAEFALEAWLARLAQALSSGAGNAKRWKVDFDPSVIEADIDRAAGMLAALNPKSDALVKLERRKSRAPQDGADSDPDGTDPPSRREAETIPSGSQGKGKGKGKGTQRKPPSPPAGGEDRSDLFERAWALYPEAGRGNHGKGPAWAEWPAAAAAAGSEAALLEAIGARTAWLKANPAVRPKAFHRWLRDRGFETYLRLGAGASGAALWAGPAEIWDLLSAPPRTEAFARSCLAFVSWQDAPVKALVSASATTLRKLRDEVGPLLDARGIQLLEKAA